MATFKVFGQEKLFDHISKMKNPKTVFDADFEKAARQGSRDLIITTPKKTGTTARGWSTPSKKGLSSYKVENEIKSGKYSIARILDSGRGVVYPKKKFLYIPLSEKGRAKKSGAPIPKGLKFGIDYIFAKSSKAYDGTKFIQKSLEKTATSLYKWMIETIARVHSGK